MKVPDKRTIFSFSLFQYMDWEKNIAASEMKFMRKLEVPIFSFFSHFLALRFSQFSVWICLYFDPLARKCGCLLLLSTFSFFLYRLRDSLCQNILLGLVKRERVSEFPTLTLLFSSCYWRTMIIISMGGKVSYCSLHLKKS